MDSSLPAVTFTEAAHNYRVGIAHAHNLVIVHRQSGGDGRGKRFREVSLNRAIVLMAMASWQSVIQDLVYATFAHLPAAQDQKRINKVVTEVTKFSTPDQAKTRRLLTENLGFDPMPSWTWSSHGGQGRGLVVVTPEDASTKLNAWLRIRHAVAHGGSDLFASFTQPIEIEQLDKSTESVLGSEKLISRSARFGGSATLTLTDARQCLTFVNNMTEHTGKALTTLTGQPHVTWRQTGGIDGIW